MTWRVEFLDEEVAAALSAFPADIRANFARIVQLIEGHGLERVREPYVKHLDGPLWEMRMKGRDGIARAAYQPVDQVGVQSSRSAWMLTTRTAI
jgi:phage-related protein